MARSDWLFSGLELYAVLEQQKQGMRSRIEGLPRDYALKTPLEDLCDLIENEFRIEPLELLEEELYADSGEADIDVSQDRMRHIRDRDRPYYLKGNFVEVRVPFRGEADLFKYRTSTYTSVPPWGRVEGNEVVLRFEQLDQNAEKVKKEIEGALGTLRRWVQWSSEQVRGHNQSVRARARQLIEQRKQKLLKDADMVAALGLPMKKREEVPQTYALPVQRKKPVIRHAPSTNEPFRPEPALAETEYNEILRIVQNMVEVIERSPQAFQHMGEEDLRQHFLVQLNGQYEGQATGETFNYKGKTDILIRKDGRNVFIAECKFWKGPKGFQKTMDQLLGYTSWRDTKTAILLFNRGRQLSTVLEKVPGVVEEHPNYKRTLDYRSETGFRYVLHQDGDPNREILLTVLVFDVPSAP